MNTGTAANLLKVTLDTNIIISGLGFGGKPRQALQLILDNKIQGFTSPILLAELEDVIIKKFPKLEGHFELISKKIKKKLKIVRPKNTINILRKDQDDNRVLEAAVEGKCNYIITGDKELLDLKTFKGIKILTAAQFLSILEK